MLITGIIVKVIGALYKIPLTAFIGGVGRGYFATAYNLCMPIHAITMGVFPIALSRLVSRYNSDGNKKMIVALKRGGSRVFFFVGIIGMGIMLIAAKPYSAIIASSPNSMLTILVLAPSILFSSMAASYRGYYEGFMNMVPTSVSQLIEALFKMVFGLVFAKYSMAYLYDEYVKYGKVLGIAVTDESRALSIIYPYTSAAAMLGVTLGALLSLVFVFLYHRINDTSPRIPDAPAKDAVRELLSFSMPIMISSGVQSVFQFLDTAGVQYALTNMPVQKLASVYNTSISVAGVSTDDIPTYVYGLLSTSLDFKNLIPGITMSLGVCAVPAISGALMQKDRLTNLVNSIFRYTILIATLGGVGLAVFSEEILQLFYGGTSSDIVEGCRDITRLYGYTAFTYSMAGLAVFSVQAIGKAEKSIAPYVVSGIIRVVLNLVLIPRLALVGCVVSGAVGYLVMTVWNMLIMRRYAGVKFSLLNLAARPFFVAVATCCIWQKAAEMLTLPSSGIIFLLTKTAMFVLLFSVICIVCGAVDVGAKNPLAKNREI